MSEARQKLIYRHPLPEADQKDVVDRIDFSSLRSYSSDETPLNYSEKPCIPHLPEEYFYNKKIDVLSPRYVEGFRFEEHEKASTSHRYRNLAGQKVKPTRIVSLLTQNPGSITKNESYEGYAFAGSKRPASQIYWWRQPDEGYYEKAAKRNLAFFLAQNEPNYYVVEENSPHRLGEAKDVIIGTFPDRSMIDITIVVKRLNDLLFPLSLRLIHDIVVDF